MLFPYDGVRPEQGELMNDIAKAVSGGSHLIAHAPTGLGKTAAALAPALEYALDNSKTVFFLTSRHTQHHLAIETLKLIRQKHNLKFSVADMLGKKHMCARDEARSFFTRQFHDYCRSLRESESCDFYTNFRKGSEPSQASKQVMNAISSEPTHSEEAVKIAKRQFVCPYEVVALASRNAHVIIADYYYVFSPKVRGSFLKRNAKSLEDAIIIVDEAHNLPGRMRELLTERLSAITIERAIKESEKWGEPAVSEFLAGLRNVIASLASSDERIVSRDELLKPLEPFNLSVALERMAAIADSIREIEQQSHIGSVCDFLAAWQRSDDGFARIISSRPGPNSGRLLTLSFQCLDPSVETAGVIQDSHSVILMSGTLTPTFMYKDLLGFPENTVLKEYGNPMPRENRLPLIVASATTRFSSRNDLQYRKLASICSASLEAVKGNAVVFFPSYSLMEKIHPFLSTGRQVFKEHSGLSKEERQKILAGFRASHIEGALLLAVIGGSFSEGIDLPGDFLNAVMVVGLPLAQPDLFTKELIAYYERRFGRGWDYGYVFPAFTKALQSAGRCIRTETDRGVILFIDERYAWERYYGCFPKDLVPKVTAFYREAIEEFFR